MPRAPALVEAQKRYEEKRSMEQQRLPSIYTSTEIARMLDELAEQYGSKKAAIEEAIKFLHDSRCKTGTQEV